MGKLAFTGIGVHISTKDMAASRKFYETIGFTPVFGYGPEEYLKTLPVGCPTAPEKFRGISYKLADGGDLEITDGHPAIKPEVFKETVNSGKISAMIRVESVVPLIEEYKDRIKFPVRHYYWNSIEVALRDPDGFVLVFIAPFSDKELADVKKLVDVETINP